MDFIRIINSLLEIYQKSVRKKMKAVKLWIYLYFIKSYCVLFSEDRWKKLMCYF